MRLLSVSAFFSVVSLLIKDVNASTSPSLNWGVQEKQSMDPTDPHGSPWVIESLVDTQNDTAVVVDPAVTDTHSLLAGSADTSLTVSGPLLYADEFSSETVEGGIKGAVAPSPPQHQTRGSHKMPLSTFFVTVVLFFGACLRLFAPQPVKGSGILNIEEGHSLQEQPGETWEQFDQQPEQKSGEEEQQREEDDEPTERDMLLPQLDVLQQIQPVAFAVASRVGKDDIFDALQETCDNIRIAREAQQEYAAGNIGAPGSFENILRETIENGVTVLSGLYEDARHHGLRMARETRALKSAPIICQKEVEILHQENSVVMSAIMSHMGILNAYHNICQRKTSYVQRDMHGLPPFTRLEDRHLLGAVAANLLFMEALQNAVESGASSVTDLGMAITAVAMLHVKREQTCMYREYRDIVEGQHALWKAAKQQHLHSSTPADPAALQALDELEEKLQLAQQLLSRYHDAVNILNECAAIGPAQAASQQAQQVGQELKALLDVVTSLMGSVSSPKTTEAVADHTEDLQKVMENMASRAIQDAAAATRNIIDLHKRMESNKGPHESVEEAEQHQEKQEQAQQQQTGSAEEALENVPIRHDLKAAFHRIERKAKVAFNQAFSASVSQKESSSNGAETSSMNRVLTARKAATEAENLLGEAEMLWLQWKLIKAIGEDVEVSTSIALRATEALQQQQQELPHMRRGKIQSIAKRNKMADTLVKQLNDFTASIGSHSTLEDLAAAAAAVKGTAIALFSVVQENQHDVIHSILI
ncbi:hypothetical protein, conserved [Eimeria maxima]|uniref:Uncharacterized protein n=1 Tax=Eimeria maxima TaxID=5804 RepID=U6M6F4_EIMMA|nr:hypothetical protein, conserved [Eimeria maxima]CDJ58019.1 hypothetical protein, conserved [Eimeria maxima]